MSGCERNGAILSTSICGGNSVRKQLRHHTWTAQLPRCHQHLPHCSSYALPRQHWDHVKERLNSSGICRAAVVVDAPHAACAEHKKVVLDLSGRSIAIFWDLDNVRPPGGSAAACLAAIRIQAAASQWGGSVVSVTAYANPSTLASNPRLQAALEDAGLAVISVPPLREAADTAMQSAAYYFARAQRGNGAIVLASNDQGFSKVLRYCSSIGCSCVVIGTDHEASRYKVRPKLWAKQPLQAVSHASIKWSFSTTVPASEDEKRQLTEMKQLVGGGEAPSPAQLAAAARGTYAAARAGGQTGVWLNHLHVKPK